MNSGHRSVLRRGIIALASLVLTLITFGAICARIPLETRDERRARRAAEIRLWAIRVALPDLRKVTKTYGPDSLRIQFDAYLDRKEIVMLDQIVTRGRELDGFTRCFLTGGKVFACSTYHSLTADESPSGIKKIEFFGLFDPDGRPLRARFRTDGKRARLRPGALEGFREMDQRMADGVKEDLLASGDLLP